MKFGLLPACFLLLMVLNFIPASGQSLQEDSVFYQSALNHTLAIYFNQLGDQSRLLNGTQFPEYEYSFQKGDPFFMSDKPVPGSIMYDSVYYPNQLLLFDSYRQFVVIVDQSFKLKLVNEKINSFQIGDHHFVRIAENNLSGLPNTGYYEIVYTGRSRVLNRDLKKYSEKISVEEGITRILDEKEYFFIKQGDLYKPVNSKKELLTVMDSHRKEIQKFIRKNGLSYKDNMENTLSQAAAYFDQLDNH
jgi:hypothetical protein